MEALFVFYIICLLSALCVLPIVAAVTPKKAPVFPFALSIGLASFLVVFSLIGRFVDSYFIIVPFTFSVLALASLGYVRSNKSKKITFSWTSEFAFLVAFIFLNFLLLSMRSGFSDIFFDPNSFGAEKMYNFQYQQSFLSGKGYPPENLWFSGEPSIYYILLKVLPGISAFFVREFWQNPFSGGYLFHVADVFYISLASLMLGASTFRILSDNKSRVFVALTSALVAIIPLVSAPLRAISQLTSGSMEFWSLSRIIDNTINEYPFWNYLMADAHAHNQVMFLQVTLLAWFYFLFTQRIFKSFWNEIILAILAVALYMSNSWSVIVGVSVYACLWLGFLKTSQKLELKPFLFTTLRVVAMSVLMAAPDFLLRSAAPVVKYLVPPKYASSIGDYLNVYFFYFLLLFVFCVFVFVKEKLAKREHLNAVAVSLIFLVGSLVAGYPVIGLASFFCTLFYFYNVEKEKMALRLSILGASFLLIAIPEIFAINVNMGESLMRYNMVFKFFYENFYLLPLLFIFYFSAYLTKSIHQFRVPLIICLALTAVFCFVQWRTWQHRLRRVPTSGESNGIFYLKTLNPIDFSIISYLANLSGRAVIAEECGITPKEGGYSMAGRISAFSGKPALCGWAGHISMFYNKPPLTAPQLTAYEEFLRREKLVRTIYESNDEGLLIQAKNALKNLDVKYFVFGTFEKRNHSSTTLEMLEQKLGRIVFEQDGLGVVQLED